MAKRATEAADMPGGAPERREYREALEANGANLDAALKAGEAMLKGMTAVEEEMVGFANRCLRQTLKASHSLMGCSDVSEVFGVQCDFARTATQQYVDETAKLMRLGAEITRDSWMPIEKRTKEALDQLTRR